MIPVAPGETTISTVQTTLTAPVKGYSCCSIPEEGSRRKGGRERNQVIALAGRSSGIHPAASRYGAAWGGLPVIFGATVDRRTSNNEPVLCYSLRLDSTALKIISSAIPFIPTAQDRRTFHIFSLLPRSPLPDPVEEQGVVQNPKIRGVVQIESHNPPYLSFK